MKYQTPSSFRPSFVQLVFGIACFAASIVQTVEAAEQPNVLLIVADDLGWSDVGWHDGLFKTPIMDRLVHEGIELDRHYVQPVCTPTRTALMSGRYPGRFGPHTLVPSLLRAMPIGTETLASALKSVGYATYQSGKWHLGARPEWGPNHYGFDHSYGTLTGAADPWTHKYRPGEFEDTWHRDGKFLSEEGNATELIAADAVMRIEEKKTPWFIYVPFHAVHTPVDAPSEFKKLYSGVRFHKDEAKQDSRLRLAAMVSQLDAKVGEMISALERTEQRNNTLIVVMSDNGGIESLKNAYVGNVPDSPLNSENDPLRGQKGTLYEGGIRVCAFANWPSRWKPRKHTSPMHAVDWFPTIASLCGYQPKSNLNWDGIDQSKTLTGELPADAARDIYIAYKSGSVVISKGWKLISTGNAKLELFHLAIDPFEKNDLASREPHKRKELQAILDKHRSLDQTEIPSDLRDLKH
jgi:arylsulfatase A-like enzyme